MLISVDASPEVRFERLRKRARIGDPETFEAFQALEQRELQSDDPTTQQLRATIGGPSPLNDLGIDALHQAMKNCWTPWQQHEHDRRG